MIIVGISAWYHDSACCVLRDGKIVAAAQEERFTRKKHDSSFPANALTFCLTKANLRASEIDHIVFYDKPFLTFERLLETQLAFIPKGFKSFALTMPTWISDKLFQKTNIEKELNALFEDTERWRDKILFSEHHLSHAASAYFPSPFNQSAVLTLDGVGEWATTSLAVGEKNGLKITKELHFPHSLGLLYSAFTHYTGFKVNSGEYKVMGLAPYGEPKYLKKIKETLIDIKDDGSFRLNMDYFGYCTGTQMTNQKFNKLFGGPPRKSDSEVTQKEMDLASSVQKVTEEVLLKLAEHCVVEVGTKNLCLAGGVALNCVANGLVQKSNLIDNLWIQPAAGDAGGALGAALAAHHLKFNKPRKEGVKSDSMNGSYLGPEFSNQEVEETLRSCDAVYKQHPSDKIISLTARMLADGYAIGWFQGRMEFGPRALGGRSIIADPRSTSMQKQLNLKVKYRESFRPFAPSVLAEKAADWFDIDTDSPYMLLVSQVSSNKRIKMSEEESSLFGIDKLNVPRSSIPAVTHVDYSARIQTVHKSTNPRYHALISEFEKHTGCPVLVNTSFNVRGEPIVCNPHDAFKCFMGTELDALVIEDFIVLKADQNVKLIENYASEFEAD